MEKIKFILPVLILMSIAVSCIKEKEYHKDENDTTTSQYEDVDPVEAVDVTIDGYDPAADTTIQKIDIWRTYEKRSYSGTVSHGEEVKMLLRRDDVVLIKKSDETVGWISYWFVKELK